jgi:phage tail tape-measure protein
MDNLDNENLHRDRTAGSGDEHVTAGKLASEGVGGAAAGAAGAAIGSLAGPIGLFVGGLAGVVGGWWAGKAANEAAHKYTPDDDRAYRDAYENSSTRLADRSFDDVRPAYQAGHIAAQNPDYRDRDFDAIEGDLQHGWTDDLRARHGEWNAARPFAKDAYTRSRAAATGAAAGAVVGAAAGAAGATAANAAREAAKKTGSAVSDAGHKAANAIDDLKDRVDNNPASRPGIDPTDRPERSA